MNEKIKGLAGKLTVSRRSDEMIYLQVRDDASRRNFVEVGVTPEAFAMAVTGLSEVACEISVDGLSVVGMEKQAEKRSVRCPMKTCDRAALRDWLVSNCAEDGWHIDAHLGSQGSVVHHDDGVVLNYSVYRYVPKAGAA